MKLMGIVEMTLREETKLCGMWDVWWQSVLFFAIAIGYTVAECEGLRLKEKQG